MEPTPISLSWVEVSKVAISTGVVAIAFSWLKDWAIEKLARQREATYLALRISVILERFAFDCAEYISEQDLFRSSGGNAGTYHSTLPLLQPYPSDVDWKILDGILASRALTLPNELELAGRTIAFWYQIDDDRIPQACDDQCGKCGLRAWELAAHLRKTYDLPAFDLGEVGWDVVGVLRKCRDAALQPSLDPST